MRSIHFLVMALALSVFTVWAEPLQQGQRMTTENMHPQFGLEGWSVLVPRCPIVCTPSALFDMLKRVKPVSVRIVFATLKARSKSGLFFVLNFGVPGATSAKFTVGYKYLVIKWLGR